MENNPTDRWSLVAGEVMALNCLVHALVRQVDSKRLIDDFELEAEAARAMIVPSELPESLYQYFERICAHMRRRLSEPGNKEENG